MLNRKVWAMGLGIAAISLTGLAVADINTDRLAQANDNLTKAILLTNVVTPANKAEARQISKAKKALAAAQADVQCAIAREADASAACP
jgi:hypothetical protein